MWRAHAASSVRPARQERAVLAQGLQRSSVDPPLSSSCACLHTAFIAISVPRVFHSPLHCSSGSLGVLPLLRDGGKRQGGLVVQGINAGSRFGGTCAGSWRTSGVPRWFVPSLGCAAGPTWPHTLRTGIPLNRPSNRPPIGPPISPLMGPPIGPLIGPLIGPPIGRGHGGYGGGAGQGASVIAAATSRCSLC